MRGRTSTLVLKRYGKGRNKKEAEQVAAKYLLDYFMAHPEQVENV